MRVVVAGKGAWGGAMGELIRSRGHEVAWVEQEDVRMPGPAEMIFLAVPSQSVRTCLQALGPQTAPTVSLSKGIEIETGKRISEIVKEIWPKAPVAAVSGPSLAGEVVRGVPTAVVAAAEEESLAREVQTVLHGPTFRVYRADDLAGVEWGGSLKNVYAMAAGMCAGLGLGENSLAGLLTRSLREMVRVAVELGAKEETLYGLSGVGDLMLTSYSRASRNRRVGERIGAGDKLEKALASVEGVCEGVPTTQALHGLMAKRRVEAPVADQLFAVLFEGKSPKAALQALMERDPKAETD
jgi:glycerol-3-phosphate dehydrogenase (NAD(P)+)